MATTFHAKQISLLANCIFRYQEQQCLFHLHDTGESNTSNLDFSGVLLLHLPTLQWKCHTTRTNLDYRVDWNYNIPMLLIGTGHIIHILQLGTFQTGGN